MPITISYLDEKDTSTDEDVRDIIAHLMHLDLTSKTSFRSQSASSSDGGFSAQSQRQDMLQFHQAHAQGPQTQTSTPMELQGLPVGNDSMGPVAAPQGSQSGQPNLSNLIITPPPQQQQQQQQQQSVSAIPTVLIQVGQMSIKADILARLLELSAEQMHSLGASEILIQTLDSKRDFFREQVRTVTQQHHQRMLVMRAHVLQQQQQQQQEGSAPGMSSQQAQQMFGNQQSQQKEQPQQAPGQPNPQLGVLQQLQVQSAQTPPPMTTQGPALAMGNGLMGPHLGPQGHQPGQQGQVLANLINTPSMITYLQSLTKPTPEGIAEADRELTRFREETAKARANNQQPDTYRQFTEGEKMQFKAKFETVIKSIAEMDRFLNMFLAATKDLNFVKTVVSMKELVYRQHLLLVQPNPAFIIDLVTLDQLAKLANESRSKVILVLRQLQIITKRDAQAQRQPVILQQNDLAPRQLASDENTPQERES